MSKEDLKTEIMHLVGAACSHAYFTGFYSVVDNPIVKNHHLTEELRVCKLIEKKLEELEELD